MCVCMESCYKCAIFVRYSHLAVLFKSSLYLLTKLLSSFNCFWKPGMEVSILCCRNVVSFIFLPIFVLLVWRVRKRLWNIWHVKCSLHLEVWHFCQYKISIISSITTVFDLFSFVFYHFIWEVFIDKKVMAKGVESHITPKYKQSHPTLHRLVIFSQHRTGSQETPSVSLPTH